MRGQGLRAEMDALRPLCSRQVREQDAPHGGGVGGQSGAGGDAGAGDLPGGHACDVSHLGAVEHRERGGLPHPRHQIGQMRPGDVGEGQRGQSRVSELQDARAREESAPVLFHVGEFTQRRADLAPGALIRESGGLRGLGEGESAALSAQRGQYGQAPGQRLEEGRPQFGLGVGVCGGGDGRRRGGQGVRVPYSASATSWAARFISVRAWARRSSALWRLVCASTLIAHTGAAVGVAHRGPPGRPAPGRPVGRPTPSRSRPPPWSRT